jgi:all-trans-retinol 13,14-reductase
VMTAVPANPELWSARPGDYRRDPSYLALKEELSAMLLDRALGAIPALRGAPVAWSELSTPLTQERYTRSTGGASYGLEPNTRQFGPRRPGTRTEIKGLFLAGAALAWGPGIEGSMSSGMHAAAALLDRDLVREVRAGAVIADPARLSQPSADWDPLAASRRLSASPAPLELARASASP